MADFTVIREVGEILKRVLDQELGAEPELLLPGPESVSLESPAALPGVQGDGDLADSEKLVSVFLYRIAEDPMLKNQPPIRRPNGLEEKAPLALDLHYLVTPFGKTAEMRHLVLGKVLQAFYDRSILEGADLAGTSLAFEAEDVRLILNPVTLEETTRIWDALEESYRLSVCYIVRVALMASRQRRQQTEVLVRRTDFLQN